MKKKEIDEITSIKWLKVDISQITIFRRPTEDELTELKKQGLTLVVTVQNVYEERADIIEKYCKKLDLKWISVSVRSANMAKLATPELRTAYLKGLSQLFSIITKSEQKCLVHCQHGKHRSALFIYSTLRIAGYDEEGAKTALKEAREKAFVGIKDFRISYANKVLVPAFFESYKKKYIIYSILNDLNIF